MVNPAYVPVRHPEPVVGYLFTNPIFYEYELPFILVVDPA